MRSFMFCGAGIMGLALALASASEAAPAPTKLPDLLIRHIHRHDSIVKVRVKNDGEADTTKSCYLRVWIIKDGKLTGSRYVLVPPLKDGHSITLKVDFGSLSLDDSTIYARVDYFNQIKESNEANNGATKVIH
jgi:hypothetical protein